MKRSILVAVLGLAATAVAYGQGKIWFGNYYSSKQTTGVTYGNGPYAGLGLGPEGSATLLWGASTDSSLDQLFVVAGSSTPFGLGLATGPGPIGGGTGAGWFAGPIVTINGGTAGNYAFAIEASATLSGVTYYGFSPVVIGPTQATSSSPAPNLPTALQHASFTAADVGPEPSIYVLSSLCAAALILHRRRK